MNLIQIGLGILGVASGAKAIARGLGEAEPEGANPRSTRAHRVAERGSLRQPGGRAVIEMHTVRSIDERVGYILRMLRKGKTHPQIIAEARRIVSQKCGDTWCIPEKDHRGEVIAVFNAVRAHVRYVSDPVGVDLFAHPRMTFEQHAGDCDDYCSVLGALLLAIGYPIRLRVIRTIDSDDWNHIYLLVLLPPRGGRGRWYPLDASVDRPAFWEAPRHIIADVRDYEVP